MKNTQYIQEYNKHKYTRIVADLPKELVAQFKQKCKQENISQAQIIKEAIEQFINS